MDARDAEILIYAASPIHPITARICDLGHKDLTCAYARHDSRL
jgi:hypothetical protein